MRLYVITKNKCSSSLGLSNFPYFFFLPVTTEVNQFSINTDGYICNTCIKKDYFHDSNEQVNCQIFEEAKSEREVFIIS